MKKKINILLGLCVFLSFTIWSSFGRAQSESIYVDYYTPQFYLDYLVFFDEAGTPIYYENDFIYAVPPNTPEYKELIDHYKQNTDAYRIWFEEIGFAYLNYRRPIGVGYYNPIYYLDFIVYFDEAGSPYYYDNDTIYFVPTTYVNYSIFVEHYHKYKHNYKRWYDNFGKRYHNYRRPKNYNAGHHWFPKNQRSGGWAPHPQGKQVPSQVHVVAPPSSTGQSKSVSSKVHVVAPPSQSGQSAQVPNKVYVVAPPSDSRQIEINSQPSHINNVIRATPTPRQNSIPHTPPARQVSAPVLEQRNYESNSNTNFNRASSFKEQPNAQNYQRQEQRRESKPEPRSIPRPMPLSGIRR